MLHSVYIYIMLAVLKPVCIGQCMRAYAGPSDVHVLVTVSWNSVEPVEGNLPFHSSVHSCVQALALVLERSCLQNVPKYA